VTEPFDRASMHGVRRKTLKSQASAGLPLTVVMIPWSCPNEIYEAGMVSAIDMARGGGIKTVAFGDLFLEDIRTYLESNLAKVNMAAVFSPWQSPTENLVVAMVTGGLRAIVVCTDQRQLVASFAGRFYDESYLYNLPDDADPCGENGELHALAFGGPMFDAEFLVTVGEVVTQEGFAFADVSLNR
jgi:diphthamide synthase (EF-2-diphthine--ammonia ligase)